MVLCALLIEPFVHHSHRNITADEAYVAMAVVTIDLLHRCSSGPDFCSSVFGVSS